MSIPHYDDLYRFPGGYPSQWHDHRHHHDHDFQSSYITETGKSVDICDKFGNLRYVVQMTSQIFYDRRCYKTIVSQLLPEGLVSFLEVPEDTWEDDYNRALEDFRACVSKYQSLINAEMRDFRDIDVYKDKIDYKVQKLECCDTCKWCMKTFDGDGKPRWGWHDCHRHHHRKTVKWQCCCPENEQVFNYAKQFPQMPRFHGHDGWKKLPWQKSEDVHYGKPEWDPRDFPSIVFPTVNQMGICENYISGCNDYDRFAGPQNPVRRLAETIAPAYTTSMSCEPGDLVYYCGQLYECIESHPGGKWYKSHFTATTVDDALKKKASLGDLSNAVDSLSNAVSSSLSDRTTFDDVSAIVSNELEGYATHDEVSSMLSDALVDYTTYDDVTQIVEGSLVGYATQDDLSAYATHSDISGFITSSDTSSFVTKTDMSSFITSADVSSFVTSEDVSSFITSADVSAYVVSSMDGTYVRTDALNGVSIKQIPTQRDLTEVVKRQLSVLGGTVEGGL